MASTPHTDKRPEQHAEALLHYKPQHTDAEYIDFLEKEEHVSLRISTSPIVNFPKYFTLFTISSQHVQGDCIRECFDNMMNKPLKWSRR